jgi:large subunit ribosomal protein L9
MATELILLENIKDLGQVGDIVKVTAGFARNFLLPRGKAQLVTKNALRKAEAIKIVMQKDYAESVNVAKAVATKIADASVTIEMEANEDEKLFGSVTARMIADALKTQADLEIEANAILIDESFRTLGCFTVTVALMPEVSTELKVWIVKPTTTEEA